MSGIFEQLLAAQLETNKLLGQLVAGGGASKAADADADKAAAGKAGANKAGANKAGANKAGKGATVAQASAEVTKVRNEKGRDAALRALTIGKDTIKLAEITEENADVIFKQAKAILAEVDDEEEEEEEEI